jgi:entericidin A
MFKRITVLVCAAGVFLLAGCNTMQGLGKDVSKLGDKIEQKAEEKSK